MVKDREVGRREVEVFFFSFFPFAVDFPHKKPLGKSPGEITQGIFERWLFRHRTPCSLVLRCVLEWVFKESFHVVVNNTSWYSDGVQP